MASPRIFMSEFEERVYSFLRRAEDRQGNFYATYLQIAKAIQGEKANPLSVRKAVKQLAEDGYMFAIKLPSKTENGFEEAYTFFFN